MFSHCFPSYFVHQPVISVSPLAIFNITPVATSLPDFCRHRSPIACALSLISLPRALLLSKSMHKASPNSTSEILGAQLLFA